MAFKTRGSIALDKAQRRIALLKSIDDNLDLGHGLTIQSYNRQIETTRTALETYNTLLSQVDEARKAIDAADDTLSEMSQRMLSGVMTKYGRNSVEYAKAGGSNRKRGNNSTSQSAPTSTATSNGTATPSANESSNGTVPQLMKD